MDPSGCTGHELRATMDFHRVPPEDIKEIAKTLWAFRLLGYRPSDTMSRTYTAIAEVVRSAT